MEATRSISELKHYLDSFKSYISKVKVERIGEEVPKFCVPNWPNEVETNRMRFRPLKKISIVVIGKETKLPTLETRVMPKVGFSIQTDGCIRAEINYRGDWSQDYVSNSNNKNDRLMCFVLFSQCLDAICNRTIKLLSKKLTSRKLEKENYERLVEAVKRSLEPLIPFIVADALSKEVENESH